MPEGTIPAPPERPEPSPEGIPARVAELSQEQEGPEVKLYKISFESYNKKECEIDGMDSINAHAALTVLRDVGIYYTSEKEYQSKEKEGVQIIHVERDGDYSVLYKGLIDEEVYEIKLKKDQKEKKTDIRIFYYTLEPDKIFYVIAAKHTHYDTSKGNYKIKNNKQKFWPRRHH
jgi:hypothetical protein